MIDVHSQWSEHNLRDAQRDMGGCCELKNQRLKSLELFLEKGFPQRHDEDWKYTSLTPLMEQIFNQNSNKSVAHFFTDNYLLKDCYCLAFINGHFSAEQSSLFELSDKIILQTEASINNDEVKGLSSFYWLNGALSNCGLTLTIPKNTVLSKPIHLLYISNSGAMLHPRNRIVLSINSQATIVEEYIGITGNRYFNNSVSQIVLDENANLDYYKLQREAEDSFHIANTVFEMAKNSQLKSFHIALGAQLNREDIVFALKEKGARCELNGFYYPRVKQHIDFHTRVDHLSPQTSSSQHYKGMIDDQGHGVFNGKMIIHSQSQQVSAHQKNTNLLLSESAEIDSKPELAVLADDVRCSHGSSIGNLDKNAIFYLQSRGISQKMAKILLMQGFVNELFDKISQPIIAQYVRSSMTNLLWEEVVNEH